MWGQPQTCTIGANWRPVFGRIPLPKGEGGPKGRVRGKDLISLPLTRRFAAPSPFRRGIRPKTGLQFYEWTEHSCPPGFAPVLGPFFPYLDWRVPAIGSSA